MPYYDLNDFEKATKLGLEILDVHEADYDNFTQIGPVTQYIHTVCRYSL
ncbi:hypothetical protein ACJBXD_11270 [Streptococcus suis]